MIESRLLPFSCYRTMPWKNGLGTTQEICRFPTLGEFEWRLSIAQVNRGGPFSFFEGYQRIISVLDGAGICLSEDAAVSHEIRPFELFAFDGAQTVTCQLIEGPILDFNLIYQPRQYAAHVRWLAANPDCQRWLSHSHELLIFSTHENTQFISSHTPSVVMQRYDTLWLRNPTSLPLDCQISTSGVCGIIELHAISNSTVSM